MSHQKIPMNSTMLFHSPSLHDGGACSKKTETKQRTQEELSLHEDDEDVFATSSSSKYTSSI